MDDPAITSLMELYALRYPSARPHYMMSGDNHPENILAINKKLRKLVVMQYDPKDHHAELPGILRKMSGASAARKKDIIASMMSRA